MCYECDVHGDELCSLRNMIVETSNELCELEMELCEPSNFGNTDLEMRVQTAEFALRELEDEFESVMEECMKECS